MHTDTDVPRQYTCDKRRPRKVIVEEMGKLYEHTHERIDFDSFAFVEEDDVKWTEEREPDECCTQRGVALLKWLATRPEKEIAVVTHSSFLRHMFVAFGFGLAENDSKLLKRKHGNAEVRSVTLALHYGHYPDGEWHGDVFTPTHPSFRKGKWASPPEEMMAMHGALLDEKKKSAADKAKPAESDP